MSTVIYYFSGTGNTLEAATTLANLLDARIAAMAALEAPLTEFDTVGIIFPTYMYRPPHLAVEFMRKLQAARYLFVIAVNGGDPGDVLPWTAKLLQKYDIEVNAAFEIRLPDNYAPFGGPPEPAEQQEMFRAAEDKLQLVADTVQRKARHSERTPSWCKTRIYPALWYALGYWAIPTSDKGFWLNGKCVSCGSCAKVCPVNNIRLVDGKPVWQNHCEQCLACLQWCNLEAIELGKKTTGVRRYRNPRIKRKQIILQKRQTPA